MGKQRGFNLVELMIIVAIIAILSGIALQAYSYYVARSEVAAGLREIRGGVTGLETAYNDGKADLVDAAYIGIAASSRCAAVSVSVENDGVGYITCELQGAPAIAGLELSLRRSGSGQWTCDGGSIPSIYRPEGCD